MNCWWLVFALCIFSFLPPLQAQSGPDSLITNTQDTVKRTADSIPLPDSLLLGDDIKSKVKYSATDSIVYALEEDMVFLYGKAQMNYENIELKADFISINFSTKIMYASGLPDSTGKISGMPVFSQGDDVFNAETMRYNFETKKGKISDIATKDGDSYIRGNTVKKEPDNTTFIRNGYFTTCDAPHPHYYMKSGKIKVIPENKVVTGPAIMHIMESPTPLAIPFGFFPNKKGRSSGLIFPQYGESQQLGFFLKNGGYYLGLNDHFDLALTGDVYSRGSWRVNAMSNYAARYRFNGNVSVNYSWTKISRPEFPDYRLEKAFFIRWLHNQDSKARPGTSFSANVNAGSAQFYTFNLSSANNFLTNTFTSSIAWAKSWQGKPYNLSVSLNHNQNTQTRDISLSLPSATFNVARRTPFRRKEVVGRERWYEKIGVGYTSNFQNSISTKDTLLFKDGSLQQFRYGIQHNIPINTSFTLANYITVSPSLNYSERWYLNTINKTWDSESQRVVTDTVSGFRAARDFSAAVNMNTRIYGMLQFRKGKIAALRHVIIPTLGFSWRPDFSNDFYGYFRKVQADSTGRQVTYSIFENGLFGGPSPGKSSLLNFSLDNNLEMKVRKMTDTAEVMKKVKIFESLSLNANYNIAADSLRLSPISMAGRATILDRISLNLQASFDPYIVNEQGIRVNTTEWSANNRLARFSTGNFSVNFNITRRRELKTSKGTEGEMKDIERNRADYMDLTIPFNLFVGYNFFYQNNVTSPDQRAQTINFSGDLSLTEAWKINFNTGYDFQQKDISYTSIGINRDLHCWVMSVNWVPFGFQQNYFFQINVKSPILQDLKLTRKTDRFDNR